MPKKPITYPSDAASVELANIAKVPAEPSNRECFRNLLRDAIRFVHESDPRNEDARRIVIRVINKPTAIEAAELERIAELADQLYVALDRCRTKDPAAYILEGHLERGSFSAMLRLRNAVRKAATDAKGLTRRRPIKHVSRLCKFLALVLSAVDEAGGKLTLDKNYLRNKENIRPGNMLRFLDRLPRYLPQDFLPRKHPIRLYSRVRKDWARGRANRTQIPA